MEYINFLGYYYGEEELNLLLNALAIADGSSIASWRYGHLLIKRKRWN